MFYAKDLGEPEICGLYNGNAYDNVLSSDVQLKSCACYMSLNAIKKEKRKTQEYASFIKNKVVKQRKPKKVSARAINKSYDVVSVYEDIVKTIFYPRGVNNGIF